MVSKIEISHKTILFTLVVLGALWFLTHIIDIVLLLFVSFTIMSALRPIVEWLELRKIPRIVSIFVVYIILVGVVGGAIAGMIPSLVLQSTRLIQSLPQVISTMLPYWNIDLSFVSNQIAPLSENIVKFTVGIFTNIMATLTVLVFTFYFLLERKQLERYLNDLLGEQSGSQIFTLVKRIEVRLGGWVLAELFLMLFIGILSYVGLTILRVEYALPLALIAGILEIVPTIGPIISSVPAIIVALSVSPLLALSVAALYFIVQQLENQLIVPLVMKKSIGFSPVITLLSLMIGARFAGIAGAVLAVPIVLVLQELISFFFNKENR